MLALIVLGSLLAPKYILSLDIIFAPNMNFDSQLYGLQDVFNSSAPLYFVIQQLGKFIPFWVLQKVIFLVAFFLAGLGMHRLCPVNETGKYFAGLFYVVNPFTYVRFLVGQWALLLAYALTPFAIKAFIDLLEDRSWRNTIKVVALTTLMGMFMVHGYFLLFFAYFVVIIAKMTRERRQPTEIKGILKWVALCAMMVIGLNVYWLAPGLIDGAAPMLEIGREDLLLFSPRATSNFRVAFDVASMHGFWRDFPYLYTNDFLRYWFIWPIYIICLAIYGFILRWKNNDIGWLVKCFVIIGTASFFLALGTAGNVSRGLFEWLYSHFPYFEGFRDSHKFTALLCLSYAYLGGLGVGGLVAGFRRQRRQLLQIGLVFLVIFALITPLFCAFPIFGLYGQVRSTDYPQPWYEVNDYLNQDEEDFNVLFLPWHLYMDYSWLPNRDKRMANPAWKFYTKPIIAGENLEHGLVYSQSTNPISKYVEFLLRSKNVDNLGELLAPLNVKYVLLVHEVDYESYNFLYEQKDLTVELEKDGLTLFRNLHPVARAYGVKSLIYVRDWEEYLELSKTQDVTEHLYIIGEGISSGHNTGMHPFGLERRNPVKYKVAVDSWMYIVFTVPQDVSTKHWEYDGQKPMKNLGFMPAFVSDEAVGNIIYTRFYRVYLPSYIISLVTLVLILLYYFLYKKGFAAEPKLLLKHLKKRK